MVGMFNVNFLLVKLVFDNEVKKILIMRVNWFYEDIEKKVWFIFKMIDFWGIGNWMEKRLYSLGIFLIKELVKVNFDLIKKEFGIMGLELWFYVNGIDESNVYKFYKLKLKGIGNF